MDAPSCRHDCFCLESQGPLASATEVQVPVRASPPRIWPIKLQPRVTCPVESQCHLYVQSFQLENKQNCKGYVKNWHLLLTLACYFSYIPYLFKKNNVPANVPNENQLKYWKIWLKIRTVFFFLFTYLWQMLT